MNSPRPIDGNVFKVPVSCIADFVSSSGRSAASILRPYKFGKRGEGAGRSGYYRPAINTIRKYHGNGNNLRIFQNASEEFQKKADQAQKKNERTKFEKNIVALKLYERVYKNRNFKVLPNHRIAYRIGKILVTASPDLWVQEGGTQVLLKIGISKKNSSYVDLLLTIIRKAAITYGYRVRAKNVVYLNVSTGKEMICQSSLKRFNRTFDAIALDIARTWPSLTSGTDKISAS